MSFFRFCINSFFHNSKEGFTFSMSNKSKQSEAIDKKVDAFYLELLQWVKTAKEEKKLDDDDITRLFDDQHKKLLQKHDLHPQHLTSRPFQRHIGPDDITSLGWSIPPFFEGIEDQDEDFPFDTPHMAQHYHKFVRPALLQLVKSQKKRDSSLHAPIRAELDKMNSAISKQQEKVADLEKELSAAQDLLKDLESDLSNLQKTPPAEAYYSDLNAASKLPASLKPHFISLNSSASDALSSNAPFPFNLFLSKKLAASYKFSTPKPANAPNVLKALDARFLSSKETERSSDLSSKTSSQKSKRPRLKNDSDLNDVEDASSASDASASSSADGSSSASDEADAQTPVKKSKSSSH